MSDLDKMKMDLEAARFEVVQSDKEISGIRLALRSLASSSSEQNTDAGAADADANSLKISATKVKAYDFIECNI